MPNERYTYRDFRFANFPEIFSDATDAKMVLKKLVSMDMRISYPKFLVQYLPFYSFDRPSNFTTVIEAKLLKVGPGLQN